MQPLVFDAPIGRPRSTREVARDRRGGRCDARARRRARSDVRSVFPFGPPREPRSTRRPWASASRPSLTAYASRRPGSPSVAASRSRNWPGRRRTARGRARSASPAVSRAAHGWLSSSTPAAIATSAAAWPYQNARSMRVVREASHAGRRAPRRWRRRPRTPSPAAAPGALSRREAAVARTRRSRHQADGGSDPGDLEQQPQARDGGDQIHVRSQARTRCRTAQGIPLNRARRRASADAEHDDIGQIRCCDHGAGDRCSESPGRKARARHGRSMRDRRRGRQARLRRSADPADAGFGHSTRSQASPATAMIRPEGRGRTPSARGDASDDQGPPRRQPGHRRVRRGPGDREGRATPGEPDGCPGHRETRHTKWPIGPTGNPAPAWITAAIVPHPRADSIGTALEQ